MLYIVFDVEHVNEVTDNVPFHKFALGLWNYCTLDNFDIGKWVGILGPS